MNKKPKVNKIYASFNHPIIDRIVLNKRIEMTKIIKKSIRNLKLKDALDVGSTSDTAYRSSNYIIKHLTEIKKKYSLSDQLIKSKLFDKNFKKSIIDKFSKSEITKIKSDIVLSNATIEHVGSFKSQIKMTKNMIYLAKKLFIISTPNRFHPIEFHTKLPFLHWLPKKIHRKILNILGLKFHAKEKNLNLLSKTDLIEIMRILKFKNFKIFNIKFFGITSNYILVGKIKH